jgi:hypothetical protein
MGTSVILVDGLQLTVCSLKFVSEVFTVNCKLPADFLFFKIKKQHHGKDAADNDLAQLIEKEKLINFSTFLLTE